MKLLKSKGDLQLDKYCKFKKTIDDLDGTLYYSVDKKESKARKIEKVSFSITKICNRIEMKGKIMHNLSKSIEKISTKSPER